MKKYIILIAGFCVFLTTTAVFAVNNNGQPFQAIWEAIKSLQEQIANIQLTPGPQGLEGPLGPQGPRGEPGLSGKTLKVFDATGKEAGYFLSPSSNSNPQEIVVFDINYNKIISYEILTGTATGRAYSDRPRFFYFESDDCSGTPFLKNADNPYLIYFCYYCSPNKFFITKGQRRQITINSSSDGLSYCVPQTSWTGFLTEVERIDLANYNYMGPLEIREE